ncbi:MAG: hypothetical protein KIT16_23470, partial [Rhodospirillaceae bacterium]|nr:hypothetical protein [Rhodospirillaceae bacterium]
MPDFAAPFDDDAVPPAGQAPLNRRAPPPPGEALQPGHGAPAPSADPVSTDSPSGRRVAPPSRPLMAPASTVHLPGRSDDAAMSANYDVRRGPRLDAGVTHLQPGPAPASPFPVPPISPQAAPASAMPPRLQAHGPVPGGSIHVPPSRAQAAAQR